MTAMLLSTVALAGNLPPGAEPYLRQETYQTPIGTFDAEAVALVCLAPHRAVGRVRSRRSFFRASPTMVAGQHPSIVTSLELDVELDLDSDPRLRGTLEVLVLALDSQVQLPGREEVMHAITALCTVPPRAPAE